MRAARRGENGSCNKADPNDRDHRRTRGHTERRTEPQLLLGPVLGGRARVRTRGRGARTAHPRLRGDGRAESDMSRRRPRLRRAGSGQRSRDLDGKAEHGRGVRGRATGPGGSGRQVGRDPCCAGASRPRPEGDCDHRGGDGRWHARERLPVAILACVGKGGRSDRELQADHADGRDDQGHPA